jgi:hypothetical protein
MRTIVNAARKPWISWPNVSELLRRTADNRGE